jgi:uncharacterized membrane protein YidH (DUF202 family)
MMLERISRRTTNQARLRPVPTLLVLVGVLLLLAGIVFTLQGMGIVGPHSSFMYNNPTWIYQGVAATLVGAFIVVGGLVMGRRRMSVSPK